MDDASPTVDSHVRFMGPMFIGYRVAWLDAVERHDARRMRLLASLMGLELATPAVIEALMRRRTD